jgi:hypothetical protein
MARFLKITALILFTCMLATVGLVAGRRAIEPSIAVRLLSPGACPQPCWRGIQPGKTTLDQAEVILRADGKFTLEPNSFTDPFGKINYQLCWSRSSAPRWEGCATRRGSPNPNDPIDDIVLIPEIRLGEVVQALGQPTGFQLRLGTDTIDADLYFGGNIRVDAGIIYSAMMSSYNYQLTPYITIVRVTYFRPEQQPRCNPHPWRGFGTPGRDTWRCQQS